MVYMPTFGVSVYVYIYKCIYKCIYVGVSIVMEVPPKGWFAVENPIVRCMDDWG